MLTTVAVATCLQEFHLTKDSGPQVLRCLLVLAHLAERAGDGFDLLFQQQVDLALYRVGGDEVVDLDGDPGRRCQRTPAPRASRR